jgi:hypothetical protein
MLVTILQIFSRRTETKDILYEILNKEPNRQMNCIDLCNNVTSLTRQGMTKCNFSAELKNGVFSCISTINLCGGQTFRVSESFTMEKSSDPETQKDIDICKYNGQENLTDEKVKRKQLRI